MYMARKNPVASKVLNEIEIKRKQDIHKQRLRNMTSSVDHKPTTTDSKHLYRNAKREQMMEDRYAQIEHENRILLSKMGEIMTRSRSTENVSSAWQYGHSLNRDRRKAELRRITEDNLRILHRIQTVKPQLDHRKWEEDRMKQERLVDSICEYKRGGARAGDGGYGMGLSPRASSGSALHMHGSTGSILAGSGGHPALMDVGRGAAGGAGSLAGAGASIIGGGMAAGGSMASYTSAGGGMGGMGGMGSSMMGGYAGGSGPGTAGSVLPLSAGGGMGMGASMGGMGGGYAVGAPSGRSGFARQSGGAMGGAGAY